MRLASAYISGVLLAASAALAAPSPTAEDPTAPHAAATASNSSATAPQNRWQEDVGRARAAGKSSPRFTGPATFNNGGGSARDQMTEAVCYNVFGQLRCDRVPAKVR